MLVAAAKWLRGDTDDIVPAVQEVAKLLTLRLAEHLARYISRLMRPAEDLTDQHTLCLMYATYWVKLIFTELLGATQEDDETNKQRAPSGPVKVFSHDSPKSMTSIKVTHRASSLLVWFPAKWVSKIAPVLVNGPQAEEPQPRTSTVTIQRVESAKRVKSTDNQEAVKGSLKAARFNAASLLDFTWESTKNGRPGLFCSCYRRVPCILSPSRTHDWPPPGWTYQSLHWCHNSKCRRAHSREMAERCDDLPTTLAHWPQPTLRMVPQWYTWGFCGRIVHPPSTAAHVCWPQCGPYCAVTANILWTRVPLCPNRRT